jgi:hypothetical protein
MSAIDLSSLYLVELALEKEVITRPLIKQDPRLLQKVGDLRC